MKLSILIAFCKLSVSVLTFIHYLGGLHLNPVLSRYLSYLRPASDLQNEVENDPFWTSLRFDKEQ